MSSTALNDKYMQICGTICSGISSDYPMLIWMGPSMRPFLVPCSVLCGVSLYNITSKSLRTKMCTTHCLFFKNGTKVTAIVRKDRKESNDYTVKAIIVGANKNNHEETQYGCFVVDCAVSDKPRQCYTEKFGEVVVPPMLAGPNPIANIPYRALVDIKIMDNSEDGSRVIDPTKRIFLRPVLVKILSVCPYHPSDVTKRENFFSFLRLCPWNKDRVKQNEELDSIYINKNLPKLEERVSMCFLGGDRAFCIEDPAKQAKITLGIDYSKGSERSPVSIMEEGQMFYGDILYNPYIGGYHLQDYRYHNDLPALTRRTVFDTGLHVNESQFELWICESSLFRGFYTCSVTLSVNLIADPKRILRNVDLLWHHERGGAPVWIRVEPGGDCHRLAPFSVAALDLESEQFLAREKMAHQPNIVGVGILVDLGTGAVFSHDHPQTAIRLSAPDMEQERIPLGRFFHFSAAYWPRGDFFLVGTHHLIEKKEPLRTFYLYNEHKLAFEDDFICGTIQKDQVHLSWEFGPVEDVHDLVGEKVRKSRAPGIYGCPYDDDPNDPSYYDEKKAKVKEEPPSLLYMEDSGNVCFNPDWRPGVSGDSQIMLHSLGELDSDAQEITNLTKKPTEEWWRKDHVDKEGYCRCSQLWYLLKNVQMAWKEDQQQEQQEEEEMNLDVDI